MAPNYPTTLEHCDESFYHESRSITKLRGAQYFLQKGHLVRTFTRRDKNYMGGLE